MSIYTSTLADQANYAAIFIQPIHFTFSMITNTLNIFILTRRSLRSFPCTYYFLFYSIFNILYTCFTCPLQFLRSYGILWTNTSVGCRLQAYIVQTLTLEANLMILLASIDRFCSSSYSVKLRSFSNIKIARWIIIIGILFYAIYMSPTIAVNYWNESCLQYSQTYITIYLLSQVIVYYVITLFLMALFSFLTVFNIREKINRMAPITQFNRNRRTERQLSRMMFVQVIAYLIFTIPNGIIHISMTFIPTMRSPFHLGLRMIFTMWQQCILFLSFFLYILSGSIYRQEIIRLYHRIHGNNRIVHTNVNVSHPLPYRIEIMKKQIQCDTRV